MSELKVQTYFSLTSRSCVLNLLQMELRQKLNVLVSFWVKYKYFSPATDVADGLRCYRCGGLATSARTVRDCLGAVTVEECAPDEACVTFKRLYKKGSGESEKGA